MSALPGPTGEFPGGKISADDEGALNIGVRADEAAGIVRVVFGGPVAWLGFPVQDARQFALLLLRAASKLDGQVLTVKTE